MRIYKSVYIPSPLCGSESWTMLNIHISRITATKMRYLSKSVGKKRREILRNAQIRNELGQLPITNIILRKGLMLDE